MAVPVRTKIAGIMILPVLILGLTLNFWVVSGLSDWLSWLLVDTKVHAAMAAGSRSVWFVTALAAVGSLLLTWLLTLILTQPLLDLHRVAQRIAAGDLTPRVRVWAKDEIGEVARSVNLMIDRLLANQLALERTNQQLTAINQVATAVGKEWKLQGVLEASLRTTLDVTGLPSGWIYLFEPDNHHLYLACACGLETEGAQALQNEGKEVCLCQRDLLANDSGQSAVVWQCDRFGNRLTANGTSTYHITIPLAARGQRIGIVNLLSAGEAVAPDELDMLTTIGAQIAEAIANAQLHARLVEKEAARQALLSALVHAEEEERARLARELHDGAGQTLTSLLVRLKTLEEVNVDRAQCKVADLCQAVSGTIEQMREISHRLRPAMLEELGLEVALRTLVQDMAEESGLSAECRLNLEGRRLPFETETTLYRIVQESMTNIVRHAKASQVLVELVVLPYAIALRVEDDGQGFDVEALRHVAGKQRRLGLVSMRERIEMLDGSLVVCSEPGRGTSIQARIPMAMEELA